MSSKSSHLGHRRSMFAPLRFPSFHSERSTKSENDAGLRTPDAGLCAPWSETSAEASSVRVVVTGTDNTEEVVTGADSTGDGWRPEIGEERLERPRSRMGLLAQYIFPSLTPEPTDQHPTQHSLYRKPVPAAYPDATITTTFFEPEKSLPIRESPTQQQHSRKASVPNILRKIRRSSPDIRPHDDDAPTVPTKSATVPPVQPVAEQQPAAPRLQKIRERARSNSLEGGQAQSRLPTHDGPSSPRFRSSSAQPPTARNGHVDSTRVASVPHNVGSHSRNSSTGDIPHPEGRKLKRLLHGSRSGSQEVGKKTGAWIMGPDSNVDYNTSSLLSGEKVSRPASRRRRGELTWPGTGAVAREWECPRLSGRTVE